MRMPHLTNDVDSPRAPRDKLRLLPIFLLELR